jgi:hypothetical protein
MGMIKPGGAGANTWYTSLSGDSSQTTNNGEIGGAMPIACTFKSLTVNMYGVSGTANTSTLTVTLMKNGQATLMTVSKANPASASFAGATTDSTAGHQFSVAVGDFVSIRFNQTSGTPAFRIGVGATCQ